MKTWHVLAMVSAIWAGIYLPGLGSTELKGEEARRIMPGGEMLRTGDWVVPRVAGVPYSRKPPLINWLAAASFKVSGVRNEWSARMPSALSAWLLAAATGWVLARTWNAEAGAMAAIFLLTNVGLVEKGRLAEIEAVYIALFGAALLVWTHAWLRGASAWSRWVPAFVFLGLGFLTKGPPHLLFFYLIVVAVLAKGRQKRELLHPAHVAGWVVFALLVGPWAIANAKRNPQGDSGAVWAEQLTSRLSPDQVDFGPWLLQIPQSLINYLPWALLLPLLWHGHTAAAIEAKSARAKALFRGMRWGLACGFLIIVLIPTSRPRFSMPLMAPASILLGMAVAEVRGERRERVLQIWGWACAAAIAGVTLACLAIPWLNPEAPLGWRLGSTAVLAAAGAWMASALVRTRRSAGPVRLGVFSAGFFVLVAGLYLFGVVPLMGRHENVRNFAGEIRAAIGNEAGLVIYGAGHQPFVFYLGDQAREIAVPGDLPPAGELEYVLMREGLWAEAKAHFVGMYGPGRESGRLVNPREPDHWNRYVLVQFGAESGEF